eukprot:gb/GEZN01009030.1/.p1 GENE.gb/GEZN01009030.1/~~gb/GEZN01009030.1/.p1  ORF type:complete len:425 (-),score=54.64 gb/GEZN01009030.1/:92-1330(-)
MSRRQNRKNDRLEKLRAKLKKRHASLADDFDYLLYYVIFLKDEVKEPLIFQAEKVGLSMTNNQERAIMEGVTARAYSVKEANDLLVRDTVQIHAARWIPVNHAAIQTAGAMSVVDIDFAVWPRADLHSIEVLCFTRWKTTGSAPYELVNLHFSMLHDRELTKSIIPYLVKCIKGKHEKKGGILFNAAQNLGLWVSPRYVKNSLTMSMTSMMLCFPQDELTSWDNDVTIPGDNVGGDRLLEIIQKTSRGRFRIESPSSSTPASPITPEVSDGLLRSLVELRLGRQQLGDSKSTAISCSGPSSSRLPSSSLSSSPSSLSSFPSPPLHQRLEDICLDLISDKLQNVDTINRLPQVLAIKLFMAMHDKLALNYWNIQLFMNCEHTDLADWCKANCNLLAAVPAGGGGKGCRPSPFR